MEFPDEWTQKEFLVARKKLQQQGVKVLLIDTILNPIEGEQTVTFSPPLLAKEPEGSVFVFYCDTGKGTKERLNEFKKRFPKHHCISLHGGRGYWRKSMQIDE